MENSHATPVNKTFRIKNAGISFSNNIQGKNGYSPITKPLDHSINTVFDFKNPTGTRNQTPKVLPMPTIKAPNSITSFHSGLHNFRKGGVKASLQLDNVGEFTLPKGGKVAQSVKNSTATPVNNSYSHNKVNLSLDPSVIKRPNHLKTPSVGLNSSIRNGTLSVGKQNNRGQVIFPTPAGATLANNTTLDMLIANFIPSTIPAFDPPRTSTKRNGCMKAYAANTHQGLIRNYNEDRVSIIMNINRMHKYVNEKSGAKGVNNAFDGEKWPRCAFFAVYDGHGGSLCCDFLRDHLHEYVIRDQNFPSNPKEALKSGFALAERKFTELAQQGPDIDRSGSCALVILIVDDVCYVANVGDSRGIMSVNGGQRTLAITRDHKPQDEEEQKRIYAAGGEVYQGQIPLSGGLENYVANGVTLMGPYRVLPGRLSVCRTFGDIEAKIPRYGGNPNVVIAEPEIRSFKITDDMDFILLGSDGVFDKLGNNEIINYVWKQSSNPKSTNIHQHMATCVDGVMRESLVKKTLDNISVLMVAFKNFGATLFKDSNGSSDEEESLSPTQKGRVSKDNGFPQIGGGTTLQHSSNGQPAQPFQQPIGGNRTLSPMKNNSVETSGEDFKHATPKVSRTAIVNQENSLDEGDEKGYRETPTGLQIEVNEEQNSIGKSGAERVSKVPFSYTPTANTTNRINRVRRPFSRKDKSLSGQREQYSTIGMPSNKGYKAPTDNNISLQPRYQNGNQLTSNFLET